MSDQGTFGVGRDRGRHGGGLRRLLGPSLRMLPFLAIAAWVASLIGCRMESLNWAHTTAPMMDKGLIVILPGIQGVDYHCLNIRKGLRDSRIQCAIKIRAWGSQVPGIKLAINETHTRGNRLWGRRIASEIAAYQKQHPGRPVYLIGQSGGGALAVFAAEGLAHAGASPIEGIILLGASLSADYDLTTALGQCRKGIVSFYNPSDMTVLEVGTAVFGNLDGSRGDSAGRAGFEVGGPALYQVRLTSDMVGRFGNPHFAGTSAAFASRHIAPWLIDERWPAMSGAGE